MDLAMQFIIAASLGASLVFLHVAAYNLGRVNGYNKLRKELMGECDKIEQTLEALQARHAEQTERVTKARTEEHAPTHARLDICGSDVIFTITCGSPYEASILADDIAEMVDSGRIVMELAESPERMN